MQNASDSPDNGSNNKPGECAPRIPSPDEKPHFIINTTSHTSEGCSATPSSSTLFPIPGGSRNVDGLRRMRSLLGPLSGIGALLLALASLLASLAILVASNGAPTADWVFSASVYLGIATALANQAVAYSSVQAAIIAWWSRASKGSTVAALQRDWLTGTSVIGALSAGPVVRLLGIACIACALVVIDGPLLQSASSVVPAPLEGEYVPLNVKIAPEVPTGYAGQWTNVSNMSTEGYCDSAFGRTIPAVNGPILNNICLNEGVDMLDVAKNYLQKVNSTMDFIEGCRGTCRANIQALALSVSACHTNIVPLDLMGHWNSTDVQYMTGRMLHRTTFITDVRANFQSGQEALDIISGYATLGNDCKGQLNLTTCTLVSAIGLYDVAVGKTGASLLSPVQPNILRLANNSQIQPLVNGTHSSTLFGIASFISTLETGVVQHLGSDTSSFSGGGNFLQFMEVRPQAPHSCPSFTDPLPTLLETLNQMMFSIGVQAAQRDEPSKLLQKMDQDLEVFSTVNGIKEGEHNVFRTNYYYFAGAAAVLEFLDVQAFGVVLTT